jgi:hypothetical protein
MDKWSDSKTWLMDLLKSAISFGVATFIAVTVLAHFEDRREMRRSKEMALLTLRQKTIPDFVSAAVYYETAAYAAYTDLYQWKDNIPMTSMLEFEREYYPRLLSGAEIIRETFPQNEEIIAALDEYMAAIESVFRVYDEVRDVRLDGVADTPINPSGRRKEFDSNRKTAEDMRKELFPLIFKSVYRDIEVN